MLSALLILLLVLIALLAIPVALQFDLHWQQGLKGECRLRWLFGLVNLSIPIPGEPKQTKEKPSRKPRAKKQKKSKPLAALRQPGFRRRLLRFGKSVWRAIGKEDLRLNARIGLGDPADTGQLWAVLGPLSVWLGGLRSVKVSIQPEFIDAVLEIDSSGRIRLVPLQLVGLFIALLLSPDFWQGLRQTRPAPAG